MTETTQAPNEERPLYTPAPGERQLTFRAVLTGCLLGAVVCAMNIYFGLQTGWSVGGSLIAAILGFSMFRAFAAVFRLEPLSRLEVNIAQTAGSAAGSMTSAAGLVAPIPAMQMLGHALTPAQLLIWAASVAWLGVFFAVPLRRQMVLEERLRFPSGTATANTIVAMFAEGEDAARKSRYLVAFSVLAAAFTFGAYFFPVLSSPPLETWFPVAAITVPALYSITLHNSPLMWGAGVLIGPRVATSLLIGALVAWGVLAPGLEALGWTLAEGPHPKTGEIVRLTMDYERGARGWILWPGIAIMVADALTSLGLSWRTMLNTFRRTATGSAAADSSPDAEMIPNAWWIGGLAVSSILVMGASWGLFGIHPAMTGLAVCMSAVLAAIAVRSTGETDINPIGGMGKVTQLVYGGLAPGSIPTNLMTAAITGSGATQAGDMMHDLKTGWLLGASPRKQLVAQLAGIASGVLVCVPIYLLFDAAWDIGGVGEVDADGQPLKVMPAPAAHAWAGMARVLSVGFDALPHNAEWAILAGLAVGAVIPVARKLWNPWWLPSGLALGVAFIVHAYSSIAMFIGMVIYQIWRRLSPKSADALGFAVASGLIAGEGLMGVFNAVLQVLGIKAPLDLLLLPGILANGARALVAWFTG